MDLKQRRRSLHCACQAQHPCPALPVPVPLLQCALPMCPPSSSTTAPGPSLPSHPRFCVCSSFPCASSCHCFSPSLLLLLSRLCPIPAPALCAAMTAKSRGSSMVQQQAQPREFWHHLGTAAPPMLLLCCFGGCCFLCCGWEDSRMSCTTESCRCLHPLSASSGLALPPAAAPRGADPLLAAAGQGMPSPTGPALTLPFTHL